MKNRVLSFTNFMFYIRVMGFSIYKKLKISKK